MTERNVIQRAFDEFGRAAGFEKKSGSWYGRSEEVIAVSNLQKSQYRPRYYFNQGFWLRQLDEEPYPKPNRCQVQLRLEGLLPAAEERINELFGLDREMSDEQRMRELRAVGAAAISGGRARSRTVHGGGITGQRSAVRDGSRAFEQVPPLVVEAAVRTLSIGSQRRPRATFAGLGRRY
jgi:hypothetical protein